MYLYFWLLGINVAVFATLSIKKKLAIKVFILLFLFLTFTFLSLLLQNDLRFRGGQPIWYENSPWKQLVLFSVMLLGMLTNTIYDLLKTRINSKLSNDGGKVKHQFIWEQFLLPLTISGILFGYIWGNHSNESLDTSTILLSYQNGFFWQTIISKLIPEKA